MNHFCQYDENGQIVRHISAISLEHAKFVAGTALIVEGVGEFSTHEVINGLLVELPSEVVERKKARPDYPSQWDGEDWIDERLEEAVFQEKLSELKTNYLSVCEGIDPATKKRMYVDCIVSETVYRMDAGRKPAESMDGGIRIFERMGSPVMPKVRDFHNNDHINVPMAVAIAIGLQQGAYALGLWVAYGEKVDEIKNAVTVEDVRNISLNFDVNIE